VERFLFSELHFYPEIKGFQNTTQSNPVIATSVYTRPRYSVRYPVVPVNSSLLIITVQYSVITTTVYNDTIYSVPFLTL
jgi:hypothetical protein